MKVPEEAIEASANSVRDDLMKVPADVRPLVLDMLIRSLEAGSVEVAKKCYAEGYKDGNNDGSILIWDMEIPYE